jgi:hypothetical protein
MADDAMKIIFFRREAKIEISDISVQIIEKDGCKREREEKVFHVCLCINIFSFEIRTR